MLATISASALHGIDGRAVTVEVHVGRGLPSFNIVGLPDVACREARDRVRAAIMTSGLDWPMQRITVNLAPSSFPKHGSALDLAIAVGVLVANGTIAADALREWSALGEVGLDGSLRPVVGMVPLVAGLRGRVRGVIVPLTDYAQAALVPGLEVRAAASLGEVVACLQGKHAWPDAPPPPAVAASVDPDLADVRGHPVARAVLEIAAAGGHHLLMSGPPGSGKTMLATRLPSLLPPLTDDQALEVTAIHSAAGLPVAGRLIRRPPFRAPHHTASAVALIGGGTRTMRPGEVSLAHHGVLFADELGEFPPSVLDALRQPIEEGVVRISRAAGGAVHPARFQLVAATNPCPCGPPIAGCRCSEPSRDRYQRRLSGPLLDRFDLRLELDRPDAGDLLRGDAGEPSSVVAERVVAARAMARRRGVGTNAELVGRQLHRHAPLQSDAQALLEALVRRGRLTARGVDRVRRVARTVADLAHHDGPLSEVHVATAVSLRVPLAGADAAVAS